MSLLNEALRKVEQRQSGKGYPEAPAGSPGFGYPDGRRRRFLVLVLLLAAVGVAYLLISWFREPTLRPAALTSSLPSIPETSGPVERVVPEVPQVPQVVVEDGQAEPEIKADPVPPSPKQPAVVATSPVPPAPPEEPVSAPENAAASSDNGVFIAPAQGSIKTKNMTIGADASSDSPVIKKKRQTPAAADRALARDIRSLVDQGAWLEARQRLQVLLANQPAQASLQVWARALLVNDRHREVLDWLTEERVEADPGLRLLRARALLAEGAIDRAVAGLEVSVPRVEDHADYRVTLATLLYQQGRFAEAAGHWAALIAWDDSQGNWWAGLAMALEARGESVAAIRAYEQASRLPGLEPSLADYVRQRLQSLRAG